MFGEQGGGVSFSYLINATTIPALESLAFLFFIFFFLINTEQEQ